MSAVNMRNTHILPRFEYHEPKTLNEALELLAALGPEAKVLAGGTDLLVKMKTGALRPKHVVNIKRIPGLRYVKEEGGEIKIGALATWHDLETSPLTAKVPALLDAVRQMGGLQIRVMGTLAGNLCNASPASDGAPPLMVHGARVLLVSKRGARQLMVEDFFLGPGKTAASPDELLLEIAVPVNRRGSSAFVKVARTAMDLAIASAAAYVELEGDEIADVKVALGSVAPRPVRARSVEEALRGAKLSESAVKKAAELVVNDISPITDVRSTAWYRREVSKVLVYDAVLKAAERARRGAP